ncbi:MAG: flavin reductase family protein [Deferrisomatales bacterium]|nr:flavin reductase family protein [Deferrisomatales bacterium]
MKTDDLSRLLSSLPCPEVLLCVQAGDVKDVVAVTTMWVSYDPVIAAVYLKPGSAAHRLVNEGRNFTLNVVDEAHNRQALLAGSLGGDDPGKLDRLDLGFLPATTVPSPRIEGVSASYECRVLKVAACGTHDLFLGLVTDFRVAETGKPVIRYRGESRGLGGALPGPDVKYPH